MLVEDDPVNQLLVAKMLNKEGHTVRSVGSGKEALPLLRTHSFDVVIMDIEMPELDGVATTRLIREQEQVDGKRLPIVALTGHDQESDKQRFSRAGMDGHLAKPVDIDELRRVLYDVTEKYS